MGLTVSEVLLIEAMGATQVIAGRKGLNREIIWVTVIEVLDEIQLLQKGEFLITTASRQGIILTKFLSRLFSNVTTTTFLCLRCPNNLSFPN
jgi:hypothetical protein